MAEQVADMRVTFSRLLDAVLAHEEHFLLRENVYSSQAHLVDFQRQSKHLHKYHQVRYNYNIESVWTFHNGVSIRSKPPFKEFPLGEEPLKEFPLGEGPHGVSNIGEGPPHGVYFRRKALLKSFHWEKAPLMEFPLERRAPSRNFL